MKPALHLFVPDPSLRAALVEQSVLAELGDVQSATLPAAPPEMLTAVVVDEAALDAKNIKKLRAIKNDHCVVLLLGSVPEGVEESLVTELFAKPVRLGHLLGRLQFYLEVAPKLRSKPVMIGPFLLQAQQRNLTRGEETIRLTEKETDLLEYLAQSEQPVGREDLLAQVWGYDGRIDTHTLETHIYQLRRKIGAEFILNEGGHYRLAK